VARRTYDDALEELHLRLGNRSDATEDLREQWLNDAMYKVGNQYEHREIEATDDLTLLISTDNVAAPADMWWPVQLQNRTDNTPIHLGDKDLIEAVAKRTSRPFRFYTWGTSFYFDANADTQKTIRLWYVQKPTRWAGSATLPYQELYDVIVMMWATKIGLTALRDLEQAGLVGIEISMYVSQHKIPLREQKKNDAGTMLNVRKR
jgi:hypothetical protein